MPKIQLVTCIAVAFICGVFSTVFILFFVRIHAEEEKQKAISFVQHTIESVTNNNDDKYSISSDIIAQIRPYTPNFTNNFFVFCIDSSGGSIYEIMVFFDNGKACYFDVSRDNDGFNLKYITESRSWRK